eukprot:TRINITY_DN10730_c2_g1_i1.p1 TRINITY_DN10730_c2_g1~~TRINITY_DN10730_c2_g1_i1.p1  ORF type:complete len:240 (-),score=-29.63 TRINITY_DN10730_c2_g1_i1:12-731(-)
MSQSGLSTQYSGASLIRTTSGTQISGFERKIYHSFQSYIFVSNQCNPDKKEDTFVDQRGITVQHSNNFQKQLEIVVKKILIYCPGLLHYKIKLTDLYQYNHNTFDYRIVTLNNQFSYELQHSKYQSITDIKKQKLKCIYTDMLQHYDHSTILPIIPIQLLQEVNIYTCQNQQFNSIQGYSSQSHKINKKQRLFWNIYKVKTKSVTYHQQIILITTHQDLFFLQILYTTIQHVICYYNIT